MRCVKPQTTATTSTIISIIHTPYACQKIINTSTYQTLIPIRTYSTYKEINHIDYSPDAASTCPNCTTVSITIMHSTPIFVTKVIGVKFGRVDGEGVSSMQIHQFPFPIIPHVNCLLLCVRTLETIPPQKLFFVDIPQYPQF